MQNFALKEYFCSTFLLKHSDADLQIWYFDIPNDVALLEFALWHTLLTKMSNARTKQSFMLFDRLTR